MNSDFFDSMGPVDSGITPLSELMFNDVRITSNILWNTYQCLNITNAVRNGHQNKDANIFFGNRRYFHQGPMS